MEVTCEKPDCGEIVVTQARFGGVTVARACRGHWPDLVEFINQQMGASDARLVAQPAVRSGAKPAGSH